MGSLRFRRSVRIAPGVRLNFNKRSVGVSAGARGARVSVNSDGRSTRSVGIPGTGLYYRSQRGPRRRSAGRRPGRGLWHTTWVTALGALVFYVVVGKTAFFATVGIGVVAGFLLAFARRA